MRRSDSANEGRGFVRNFHFGQWQSPEKESERVKEMHSQSIVCGLYLSDWEEFGERDRLRGDGHDPGGQETGDPDDAVAEHHLPVRLPLHRPPRR